MACRGGKNLVSSNNRASGPKVFTTFGVET